MALAFRCELEPARCPARRSHCTLVWVAQRRHGAAEWAGTANPPQADMI